MTLLVVFLIVGLGTYVMRVALAVLPESVVRSDGRLMGVLDLLAPAVLAALVASALVAPGGDRTLPDPAALIAVGSAGVVVRFTGKVVLALAVGFPVYWILPLVGA